MAAASSSGAGASTSEPLPALAVFDLDWTLWPLDVDTQVDAPFSRDAATGAVRDRRGRDVRLFADTRRVLQWLRARGVPVAFASRTTDPEAAEQLLKATLLFVPGGGGGGGGGSGSVSAADAALTLWDLLPSRGHFQAYPSGGGKHGPAKTRHFREIMAAAGLLSHAGIAFFDDAPDNIEVATKAGAACVLLEDEQGITWERFERGLALWRAKSAAAR